MFWNKNWSALALSPVEKIPRARLEKIRFNSKITLLTDITDGKKIVSKEAMTESRGLTIENGLRTTTF